MPQHVRDHRHGPNRKHKSGPQFQDAHRVHKRKQKNRDPPYTGNARPKKYAIRPIKDRIRDLERTLLKSTDMPADVRVGHERELAALQHELITVAADKEKQTMIEKYHMVRFFERQKATRRLKQISKRLDGCSDLEERRTLEDDLHVAQVDLNYTMYYPLIQPYNSLYPKKQGGDGKIQLDDDATAEGGRGNPDMWRQVEQATREGKLEELRNKVDFEKIRVMILSHRPKPKRASDLTDAEGKSISKKGSNAQKDSLSKIVETDDESVGLGPDANMDDDSDDGFFE